jgi:hypothetical protein
MMIEILFERGNVVEFAEGEFDFNVKSSHPYFMGDCTEAVRNIPLTLNLADMGDHILVEFSVEAVETPEDWGRWKVVADRAGLDTFKKAYLS